MKTILKGIVLIAIISLFHACATTPATTEEPLAQQLLVDRSRIAADTFIGDPDMQWAREHLNRAKALLIIPNLYKGAWFLGGSGGRGVLVVRDQETGEWVGPGFYTLGSVSFGLQFGGQVAEVIVMVMTQKGLEKLYSTSFKLGGDTSVAVGPLGAGIQGAMAGFSVDYVSFARTRGAFIGVSLDGAVVDENYGWNKAYYGKPVRPVDIFVAHDAINPNSAKLRTTVAKLELPE